LTNAAKTTSGLSTAKRQLLQALKRRQGLAAPEGAEIRRRAETGPCALSFAQQRLWFLDQMEPGSSAYNVPVVIRISGALDIPALTAALNEIIRRHESLRTSFVMMDGAPMQVIAPSLRIKPALTDLSHLAPSEREDEANRIILEETREPFSLAAPPLLRARLIRLNANEHLLALTLHHIVSDGWSMGVLLREMTTLYGSFNTGGPSSLAERPIQYADFALWQRERLEGDAREKMLAYWRNRLNGWSSLDLPYDYPRPATERGRSARLQFRLSAALTASLVNLSRSEGATLFMTLLAFWQALLARYSGEQDIAVGTPVANRHQVATEPLIGFFVNTLVMRSQVEATGGFRSLLKQIKEAALGAYANQDLPFDQLVEELRPDRRAGSTPLFQVMFALHSAYRHALEAPGLKLQLVSGELDPRPAKFDLFLALEETVEGLNGTLSYDADLFSEATMRRIASHFERLIEGAVSDPERSLWTLPLLDQTERTRLLVDWNDTETSYPRESAIHELFEAQAEARPDAIAVDFEDQQITYDELNRKANQLAHYLASQGAGPEAIVGVCLDRSVELVTALIAVLKAGSAYAPLDSQYPQPRLSFMVEDTRAEILITSGSLRHRFAGTNSRIVCIDEEQKAISARSETNPNFPVTADRLAYVIYTSGSTGTPKGAAVIHRNVVRLVRNTNYVSFQPEEVFLQFAPASFDASTFEIWGSLLNGARLVVMPPQTPSLEELGAALRQHEVMTLWLTAGLFHQMVEQRLDDLAGVTQLLAGGDVLSAPHVKKALAGRAGARLINGYGPTEATTFTCCHVMQSGEQISTSVPIGKPIANTTAYVLDAESEPSSTGVIGELYAGGAGIGRGYLNAPDLTAEKFGPDPFSGDAGARLYRTGDRVRYGESGVIEFCGRRDDQVKIRGFRIETGEIEAVLNEHPLVSDSAVIAKAEANGDKRLVAYIAAKDVSANDLRGWLRTRLPEYMMPSMFAILDSLPLTPNGKIDRRALPEPDFTRPILGEAFGAPRTPSEEIMAGICEEVLGIESVGIHDDFFELGGHSLLATQVVSRTRKSFKVDVPLKFLFEFPTVAGFCGRIDEASRAGLMLERPPMVPMMRDGEAPLSFAQQRLWFLHQMDQDSPAYNIPAAIRLDGVLRIEALEAALTEVIQRHEVLRTTFSVVDSQVTQVILPSSGFRLLMIELDGLAFGQRQRELDRLVQREARRPFDLSRGPLIRAALIRMSAREHLLVVTLHHIVSDNWSIGLLVREISALYAAFSEGKPSPLPELPIQYADFAQWQRQWLQGDVLRSQLSYWVDQLAGAPGLLELPTDRLRSEAQSCTGAYKSVVLSEGLTRSLKELSRRESATLFITMLAAFKTLLYRYSGQDDIVVGSGIANRHYVEIEGLIGFFVNMLVLRSDLSGNPSFLTLLKRVRDTTLEAYAHQDLPFERLVEELRPDRKANRQPLFQVAFFLQNAPMPTNDLADLTLTSIPANTGAAHFDLTIFTVDTGAGLSVLCGYSTDLFDESTIERMLEHYRAVLEEVTAMPGTRLLDIQLSTARTESVLAARSIIEAQDESEEFDFCA
jgi:amino acid adenylation domain-containing protein